MRSDFEQWRKQYLAYTEWCLERGGLLPPSGVFHNDRIIALREYSNLLDSPTNRRLGCAAAMRAQRSMSKAEFSPVMRFLPIRPEQ